MVGKWMRACNRSMVAAAITIATTFGVATPVAAQSLLSPTINGTNPVGPNNLGGSTNGGGGTNPSGFTDLGLNQEVTFDFAATLQDSDTGVGPTPQWVGGLSFNSTTEMQVQASNTAISQGGSVSYAFSFSDDIWGFTFGMNGYDNGDLSEIRAFRDGVLVPLDDSMFTSSGTNVTVSDNGAGVLIVEGPGNDNAQEFFSVAFPLNVIIDEIVFSPTGKSATSAPSNNGNVTLQFNGIGWARPDISLLKSSVLKDGGDGFADAGDTITYTYVATNNGRVPLEDVKLVEETFTGTNAVPVPVFDSGTGGATPANMPVGESLTYEVEYTLSAADVAEGVVFNRAEVSGLPSGGVPGADVVSDLSDSSNPGDGGIAGSADEDDQTSTLLPLRPAPIMTADGPPPPLSCQGPGNYETVQFTGAAGGASTSIEVTQSSPSPISFNASNPDPLIYEGSEFTTQNTLINRANLRADNPSLSGLDVDIAQVFGAVGPGAAAYVMDYYIHINSLDQMAFVVDLAQNPGIGVTVVNSSDDAGLIDIGGVDYLADVLESDRDQSGADEQLNGDAGFSADFTVRVYSTNPGVPLSSVFLSFAEDPVRVLTAIDVLQLAVELCVGLPEVQLVKSVSSISDTNLNGVFGDEGDTVNYAFAITNIGNMPLTNFVVSDPTATVVGGAGALNPGQTDDTSITATRVIDATDVANAYVQNSATVTASVADDAGNPVTTGTDGASPVGTVSDVSDAGTDPVLNNAEDPAPIAEPETVETPQGDGTTDSDPTNDPTVVQIPAEPSRPAVSGLVFLDNDRDGLFDDSIDDRLPGFDVILIDSAGNEIARTASDSDGAYELFGFPPGDGYVLSFFDPDTGESVGQITGLDFDVDTVLSDQNLPIVGEVAESAVVLTKTTPLDVVTLGQSVPFTVTVENTGPIGLSQLDIVDTLPPGLVYTPGSATIDGIPVEPVVEGNTLTWPDRTITSGQTIEIVFRTLVSSQAQPGTLTASAVTVDGVTGNPVSNDGSASVRLLPEAVFDCGDVIGKVFDDRNMNGYQDPIADENRALITDQAIFDGKAGKLAPPAAPRGEPGIPGVRVVTQTGTIITTDVYGRFNVPCAELPGAMGTNFALKIDERSLPTGYRLTTENPRVMHLTAGIMTEMNFGAAIGRVVNVDLTAAAFDAGSVDPSDRLEQGLDRLLAQVSNTPSVLRLSYFHNGEEMGAMRARLRAVEEYIETEWAGVGQYRLIVERTIKRLQ